MKKIQLAVAILFVFSLVGVVAAQGDLAATAISNLNVRLGPGTDHEAIATISARTAIMIEGRNNRGDWVLVHSADNLTRGWVATRYVTWQADVELGAIPVNETIINPGAAVIDVGDLPEGDLPVAMTFHPTKMYQGPGTGFPILVSLPASINMILEAHSPDSEWLLGMTPDGAWRGWFLRGHTSQSLDISILPASDEIVSNDAIWNSFVARLESTPIMPSITQDALQSFWAGRGIGNRANVFSKVGDCHTDHLGFFVPFGVGEYNLGGYGDLQATIDYFNVSPREGSANSFVNESMAASSAFSAMAVLDPVWADPAQCAPGESPLQCEYRLIRPAVALIQFGSVDMQIYRVQDFSYAIREILNETMAQGIVPVLTTFPSNENYLWHESLQFNIALLDIAEEYGVPVINFWAALRPLPNRGLLPDNFHLSTLPDRYINLNGDQNTDGMTSRNLITLQALQVLQQQLLSR